MESLVHLPARSLIPERLALPCVCCLVVLRDIISANPQSALSLLSGRSFQPRVVEATRQRRLATPIGPGTILFPYGLGVGRVLLGLWQGRYEGLDDTRPLW